MTLPKQLGPHKDKIVLAGTIVGGLYAAALKFNFVKAETLEGWIAFVVIGLAALSAYTFNEGFLKLRKRKSRQAMPGQVKPNPDLNNVGMPSNDHLYGGVPTPQQNPGVQMPGNIPPVSESSPIEMKGPAAEDVQRYNKSKAPKNIFEGFE